MWTQVGTANANALADVNFTANGRLFWAAFSALLLFPLFLLFDFIIDLPFIVIDICFLAWVYINRKSRPLLSFLNVWTIAFFALWLLFLLSSFFAVDVGRSLGFAVTWFRLPLGILACMFWLFPAMSKTQLGWLISAYGLSLLFILLDTYVQYLSGTSLTGYGLAGSRLTGPFGEPIVGFVILHLYPILAAWVIAYAQGTKSARVLTIAVCALAPLVLVVTPLSGERLFAGWALLAITAYFFVIVILTRNLTLFVGLGLGIVSLSGLWLAFDAASSARLGHMVTSGASQLTELFATYQRWEVVRGGEPYANMHISAMNIAFDNWAFGIGMRGFPDYCTGVLGMPRDHAIGCSSHPHHTWINVFFAGGLLGLILAIGLTLKFYVALLGRMVFSKSIEARLIALQVLLIASPVLLSPLISEGFFVNFTEAWFWGGLAMSLGALALVKKTP